MQNGNLCPKILIIYIYIYIYIYYNIDRLFTSHISFFLTFKENGPRFFSFKKINIAQTHPPRVHYEGRRTDFIVWSVHRRHFCVAGVAVTATHNSVPHNSFTLTTFSHRTLSHNSHTHNSFTMTFLWQAWHLVTPMVLLCGRRGTHGTRLALVARLVWQAWHLVTSTVLLYAFV